MSLATPSQESLNQSMNRSGSLRSWEEGLEEEKEEPIPVTGSVKEEGKTKEATTNLEKDHKDDCPAPSMSIKDNESGVEGGGVIVVGQGKKGDYALKVRSEDQHDVENLPQGKREMDRAKEEGMKEGKERGDLEEIRVLEKNREKQECDRGEEQPKPKESQEESTVTVDSIKAIQDTGPETVGRPVEPGLSPTDFAQRNSTSLGVRRVSDSLVGFSDVEKTLSGPKSPLGQRIAVDRDRCISSSPRVMSAMARFQVRDHHTGRAQALGSPEPGRPIAGPRVWDTALRKTTWEAPEQLSANGSATTENPKEATPVKVSELKKRFEQ